MQGELDKVKLLVLGFSERLDKLDPLSNNSVDVEDGGSRKRAKSGRH